MTDEDLRALLDAATKGPWQPGEMLPNVVFNWSVPPDHPDATIAETRNEANARLIAAAPDLAAEVLRLRGAVATDQPRMLEIGELDDAGWALAVCVGGRWDGWQFARHPDGQWVSKRPLRSSDPRAALGDAP
jgi:hypothetical protein